MTSDLEKRAEEWATARVRKAYGYTIFGPIETSDDNLIDELAAAYIAGASERGGWVSAKARLPEWDGDNCWIAVNQGSGNYLVDLGYLDLEGRWCWTERDHLVICPVDYWMPLTKPAAPEKEGE
jgi:hypothetical protein